MHIDSTHQSSSGLQYIPAPVKSGLQAAHFVYNNLQYYELFFFLLNNSSNSFSKKLN